MNIKEYYVNMSRLYMHQTILCSIVYMIAILLCFQLPIIIPAFMASASIFLMIIYFFFRTLYFNYRRDSLPQAKRNKSILHQTLLILPTPVSSYEWKLYLESGIAAISVKKLKGTVTNKMQRLKKTKIWGFYTHMDKKQWIISKDDQFVHLFDYDQQLVFSAVQINKREYRSHEHGDSYLIKRWGFSYQIKKNGETIMTVSQGMMPIHLQELFYSSTPIIEFNSQLPEIEKIFCLGLFIHKK